MYLKSFIFFHFSVVDDSYITVPYCQHFRCITIITWNSML